MRMEFKKYNGFLILSVLVSLSSALLSCELNDEQSEVKNRSSYHQIIQKEVPEGGEQRIPKIFHQIWHNWSGNPQDQEPSDIHKGFTAELLAKHPGWEYRLWTNENSREFIATNYEWFLPTYDSYDKPIKRADSLRYFLMHHFGGVYLDMSFQCLRNIEPLLAGAEIVAGEQCSILQSINMAFLASTPGHSLWDSITKELPGRANMHVLESTGPDMFTPKILDAAESNLRIRIYDKKFLYPYRWDEKENQSAKKCIMESSKCFEAFPDAFLIKHWPGSWLRQY